MVSSRQAAETVPCDALEACSTEGPSRNGLDGGTR